MSRQEQQQQVSDVVPSSSSWGGGSNRIAALNLEGTPLPNITDSPDHKQFDHHDEDSLSKFLSYVGLGFLVSLAYLDPGNYGTSYYTKNYEERKSLWVILIGLTFALIIQSRAAYLGVSTGKHLSELCKAEYQKYVKYCLWLLAEVAVIAADIPKVIGTAFTLNILFHIPIWTGVLITGLSTLLLLGLQRYGVRKLELLITILVFVMVVCFFGEMGYVKPPAVAVLKGMFIPKLSGQGATGDAIAHNLFLHSALVLSRKIPNSIHGINHACRYFLIESRFELFVAFLINVAIVSVLGTVCLANNIPNETANQYNDLNLNSASFLLKNVLGRSSSTIYAIALLASGQSSTITGTYARKFIMQGFLDLKTKKWIRNLITRCIAITPSLIFSIIGGSNGAAQLIIIALDKNLMGFALQMIFSFDLPFALIPLLKFNSSATKMGPHKNSIYVIVISWILGMRIIGIDIYYLSTGFVGWLIHNNLPKVAVFAGLLVFPLMLIYILGNSCEVGELDHIPYREDLADIPLPE
ncbi:hypothetical protein ACB092_12G146400 [Castanea dentata]